MRSGWHCSFCGTFTGPFSKVEGLFTVLIRRPCLRAVRSSRTRCPTSMTQGPMGAVGCPIDGFGPWFVGPWDREWHTQAEHPG
jgi:hypothetical protein